MNRNKIKTKGIVLRRIDLKEADQIVTVLTQDEGKVGLLAKGSKRLKSKFLGKLELLSLVELSYTQGQDLGYLIEAEYHPTLDEEALDLHGRSLLFYMAEATQKLTPEGQACEEIFELLKAALLHFDAPHGELVFYGYMVKLLTSLGFMQAWNECLEHGGKLDLNRPYFLCEQEGSLKADSRGGPRVSTGVIKWVNYMQQQPFEVLKRVQASHQDKVELYHVLKVVLGNLLNHPFKSETFLNQNRAFVYTNTPNQLKAH